MRRALQLAAFVIAVCGLGVCQAQTAVPIYNNFSPTVKGLTLGPFHCYLWLNSPSPGQFQSACWYNTHVVYNSVQSINLDLANSLLVSAGVPLSTSTAPDGTVTIHYAQLTWLFKPASSPPRITALPLGAPAPTIAYELSVLMPDGSAPIKATGTF